MSCFIYYLKHTNQSFETKIMLNCLIERTLLSSVVSKRTFIQTLQNSKLFGTLAFPFNPFTIFTFSLMAHYTHVFHVSCHLHTIFRARAGGSSAFYIELFRSVLLMNIINGNKNIKSHILQCNLIGLTHLAFSIETIRRPGAIVMIFTT